MCIRVMSYALSYSLQTGHMYGPQRSFRSNVGPAYLSGTPTFVTLAPMCLASTYLSSFKTGKDLIYVAGDVLEVRIAQPQSKHHALRKLRRLLALDNDAHVDKKIKEERLAPVQPLNRHRLQGTPPPPHSWVGNAGRSAVLDSGATNR